MDEKPKEENVNKAPVKVKTKKEIEQEDRQEDRADKRKQTRDVLRIFWVLLIVCILFYLTYSILQIVSNSELRILENGIVFIQGVLTSVLGFILGNRNKND